MRLFSNIFSRQLALFALVATSIFATSCGDDDDAPAGPMPTGSTMSSMLNSVSDPGISGMVTFTELNDNSTSVVIDLQGTSAGSSHPAHIHMNTAAEGGDIAISLNSVSGDDGMSETIVTTLDNGTSISYDELIDFDGYVNVHQSSSDLGTLVAQGDIGQNALTGESKVYTLMERDVDGVSGMVTFSERNNGYTLATIELMNTPAGGMHPAHIHMNSALEGGDIAVTFTTVDGTTGMSMTNIEMTDGGNDLTYNEILNYDGYVNVHLSAEELGTLVAQGDIGINELTGESMTYELEERDAEGISGTVTFEERVSGYTLATISLMNTPVDGMHPAHIHMNSALEGGDIAVTFMPVNGATGMSMTNIEMTDGGDDLTYDEILNYDGYVNVHLSAEELGTLVGQGDIGSNALTGESLVYTLNEKDVPGVNGMVTFAERMDGTILATIMLDGTTSGTHPAHIHMNSAAEGGDIAVTFTPVNGATGMSMTNISMTDGGMAFLYDDVATYNGYVNVHLSAAQLGTLVAQGDIGSNASPTN